jgi:hypothetical protein
VGKFFAIPHGQAPIPASLQIFGSGHKSRMTKLKLTTNHKLPTTNHPSFTFFLTLALTLKIIFTAISHFL